MDAYFKPPLNQITILRKFTLMVLWSGSGILQIDFKNYTISTRKALFLSPGQYYKFLSGELKIHLYEFPEEIIRQIQNSRFLFKHLVGLGHIELDQNSSNEGNPPLMIQEEPDPFLVLNRAIEKWIQLNPFQTNIQDLNLLFNLKDMIDKDFRQPLSLIEISKKIGENKGRIQNLVQGKLHRTLFQFGKEKLLLETKRELAFSKDSIKEIAYDYGFRDPNYFTRFFHAHTQKSPLEFREEYPSMLPDESWNHFLELIEANFRTELWAEFYARKLNISTRTLHRKIHQKMGLSFLEILQERRYRESLKLLDEYLPIHQIAFELSFKEPNHFSAFFKHRAGFSPSEYLRRR